MPAGKPKLTASLAAFGRALHGAGEGARIVVVVAHPDDETIGLGGHLAALPQAAIVHVTDGAPRNMTDALRLGFASRESYAGAREAEVAKALNLAGHNAQRRFALHLPDQEAALHLAWLARRLAKLFADVEPEFVCTHAYEGGHPDHDACAFAVAAGCQLRRQTGAVAPSVVEMAFYHADDRGEAFFQRFAGPGRVLDIVLAGKQLELKKQVLACFATQRDTLAAFGEPIERFRIAPAYDFKRAPSAGRPLYEQWGLGMNLERWLGLAQMASRDLELDLCAA